LSRWFAPHFRLRFQNCDDARHYSPHRFPPPSILSTLQVGTLIEEPKFSHVSRNLFLTLAANGRINEASKVIGAFTGENPALVWLIIVYTPW